MKYLLLMFGEAGGAQDIGLRDDVRGEAVEAGEWIGGAALAHPALVRTVRVRDGVAAATTDGASRNSVAGPLAGFWLLDCESLDRAIELAARLPEARAAAVEVVPLMGPSGLEM